MNYAEDMGRMPELIEWLDEQAKLARDAAEPEICPCCNIERHASALQEAWQAHLDECYSDTFRSIPINV